MQVICKYPVILYKELEYPWILVFAEVLEPISHGYQVLNFHKWQHSGQIQGDERSFRNFSYCSFFPFLHRPHTSLNPIPLPCSLLYLASCPAFKQHLPRTRGTRSLMPDGRGKEQNPPIPWFFGL